MSDATEELRQELDAAQRTIAELQTRLENRETTYRLTTLELEENRSALLFMLEDLESGRRKIERAHQEWMTALDVVDDPIFLHDKEFRILRCNKAYQQCAGIPFEQIIGQPYYEVFPKNHAPLPCCLRAMEKAEEEAEEEEEEEEEEEVAVGGAIYRSRSFSVHDEQGVHLYSVHILEDITESRQADVQLRLFRDLLDQSSDDIFIVDPATSRFLDVNETACRDLRYTRDELLQRGVVDIQTVLCDAVAWQAHVQELRAQGHALLEFEALRKDGSRFPVEASLRHITAVNRVYIIAMVRDITGRKRAEVAIQHANRALAALSEVNRNLVYATDENELLQAICRAIVEQKDYRLAWVGYVQHDEHKSIKIMAHAGHDDGYMDAMQLTWAETERGRGPGGRAVRSGATQICQDMANDPQFLPWRAAALERGYASCITLPLTRRNGKVFGILSVYSTEVNAFSPAEIDLLEEMAGDMAFGVRALHTRQERDLALEQNRQQLVRLQTNLEDTVRAIATIAEMRDPYTSGHQTRVADLAAAIARQMGLPEEQVHGIHLAGVVHDLGKIRIPAEILSKPGKISDIERSLIKVHPQAGYDVLQGIDFPWPIAQMVLQHHERLDGSGYPQGLKGDQIIIGARILSVADVVEAISAHRPYRPGLGIEAALDEITKQRGAYYDSQAVDACLAVFREQGYTFK